MAIWQQRSVVKAPRNGTTAHTISFTPAQAGSLLVLVMEGSVTHTVPTGWTRQIQALSNTELSAYTKTATAGESSFSTSHNGSNYPVIAVVYEFPEGSTWVAGVFATGATVTSPTPLLSGLTGTNLLFGAVAGPTDTSNAPSAVWPLAEDVEDVSEYEFKLGTDGYFLGIAYWESFTSASGQLSNTANDLAANKEALTFAVAVAEPPTGVEPLPASRVVGGVLQPGNLFYWDAVARHELAPPFSHPGS